MSELNTPAPESALIVIPDWGLAWYVYCLEYAVVMSISGKKVSILDLSNLNPMIFKRRIWRLALDLAQKNRLNEIKRRVAKTHDIRIIKTVLTREKSFSPVMIEERREIFISAMASKYSSLTGRRDTQLGEIDSRTVELERYFFNSTVNLICRLQKKFNFNEVITVNGRYIVDGAVVLACKESQVKCSLIEAASSKAGKYAVYKKSPHDIPSVQQMHQELWDRAGSGRNDIAEKGLQKKLSGLDAPGFNFRANFNEEFIDMQEPVSSKLAVFFPSSDREFPIFPGFIFQKSFGGSQSEAFLAFSRIAKAKGYRVIVRVHPVNSKAPRELQDKFADIEDKIWQELCKVSGTEIIESRSQVSSYDLIKKADLCATYASSISIECILSEKPTLILSESEITYCIPEICAFNEAELTTKFNEQIPIMNKKALYPYGYWLQSAGMQLKLFEFISDHEVYFGNKLVNEYRFWARSVFFIRHLAQNKVKNSL